MDCFSAIPCKIKTNKDFLGREENHRTQKLFKSENFTSLENWEAFPPLWFRKRFYTAFPEPNQTFIYLFLWNETSIASPAPLLPFYEQSYKTSRTNALQSFLCLFFFFTERLVNWISGRFWDWTYFWIKCSRKVGWSGGPLTTEDSFYRNIVYNAKAAAKDLSWFRSYLGEGERGREKELEKGNLDPESTKTDGEREGMWFAIGRQNIVLLGFSSMLRVFASV